MYWQNAIRVRRTSPYFRNRAQLIAFSFVLFSCGLNPQNADIELNETLPEAKITVYQEAIDQLGLMSSIYSDNSLKIMSKDILDNTGTSVATSAEIPRDITEMVKSTLNGIGGNIRYIPYEPEFMTNTANTGYSDYGDKILPQVILSGGITEFDRGLVTDNDGLSLSAEIKSQYGIEFDDQTKSSLSSVTLDFNLIDFKTFTGIPRIQAVNGIKLHKGTRSDNLGFTIKSVTFGAKGEIKKVQGRHAGVRLLVQISMIQIIGRYQKLPYWRLIPGVVKDNVVIDQVLADFYALTESQKIAKFQELLYLHGFGVTPNGQLDGATQGALQSFSQKQGLNSTNMDQTLYLALYEHIPLNAATRQRRKNLSMNAGSQVPTIQARQSQERIEVPPPRQEPVEAQAPKRDGSLKIATEKKQYAIGDTLKINFSVSDPMYVRIVVINSKGAISTLFPNAYQNDNFCKPGKNYSIPPSGAEFTLDISEPKGVDKIRAIGSSKPIPSDVMFFTKDGQFDDSKMSNYNIRSATDYVIQ